MTEKTEPSGFEINGIALIIPPDASSEQIVTLYRQALDGAIDSNSQTANRVYEDIISATGKCATGAIVWKYVETSDKGAIAEMTCGAPEGALAEDEDDGSTRLSSPPRRFDPEHWAKYTDQLGWNRG